MRRSSTLAPCRYCTLHSEEAFRPRLCSSFSAPRASIYRERVTLASGRFVMIDDGLGFQLVPWRSGLERQLGRHVSGVMLPGGGINWSFGRKHSLGL